MLSTQRRVGWGLGLKNIRQQWRTAKQQLTKYTEHVTQKTNPRAQAPGVCEKTFSTYFVPQPVENTTYVMSNFVTPAPSFAAFGKVLAGQGQGCKEQY